MEDVNSATPFAEYVDSESIQGSPQDCITGLDHIAIAVVDLVEAIDWYTKKFGFKVLKQRKTFGDHTAMLSAVLVAGGAVIVLVQGTTAESQVSRFIEKFGPGVQHIAFNVVDMDMALRRVERAGGAAETPMIVDEGIRQSFLRRDGGSGVRVELIERRGGDFSDRSVEQLFRSFESNDIY
jgi:methylmalonyl-CoA/ethylmalonyl-CoA epimerase